MEVTTRSYCPQGFAAAITEALYRGKGFSGELLDQVVATITANRDRWVGTIMEEKRHLQPAVGFAIGRLFNAGGA